MSTAILKEKQAHLKLHKLAIDVATRWNSALDMLSRYLEQRPAIYAAVTSKELPRRENDSSTLSERDVASPKELVAVLTPLKIVTKIVLCEENVPTLSMILPLHHQVLNYIMKETNDYTALIKQVKQAVVNLTVATLFDPCFKSTPFLFYRDR